jgi:hypothetical protein
MAAGHEQALLRVTEDALEATVVELLAGKSPDLSRALSTVRERIGA